MEHRPADADIRAVHEVAQAFVTALGRGNIVIDADLDAPHETQSLSMDCSKARTRLRWRPRLGFAEAVA